MRLILFRGRRELTYSKDWLVGGPYTWQPAETIPVEDVDAQQLVAKCPTDFIDVGGAPDKAPEPVVKKPTPTPGKVDLPGALTCVLCGKVCKSAGGLTTHMKSCKGADS